MSVSNDKMKDLQRQKIRRGIIYRELAVPEKLTEIRKAFLIPIPRFSNGAYSKPRGNEEPRMVVQLVGAPGRVYY